MSYQQGFEEDDFEYSSGTPQEDDFDCHMLSDGTCMAAGSEECDWECPWGPVAQLHKQ